MKLVLLLLTAAGVAAVAFCDGGEASDPNGDTGREVAVCVEGTEDVRLEIDFGLGWEHASTMTLMSTALTEVPVFPVEICDRGELPSVTVAKINALLAEVNEIYEQVGLKFRPVTNIVRLVNNRLNRYGLSSSNVSREVVECFHNTGSVEVYFVAGNGSKGESVGRGGVDGIVLKKGSQATTFAHEIGHACGLRDIYHIEDGVELVGEEDVPEQWKLPSDWGTYELPRLQSDIIRRLLMYGHQSDAKSDIPASVVYGIGKRGQRVVKELLSVGRSSMTNYPPISR